MADVKPASVKKKLKDKAFARSVSRDDIYHGVEELGVDLEEHITFVREALLEIAGQIGVAGNTPWARRAAPPSLSPAHQDHQGPSRAADSTPRPLCRCARRRSRA